MTQAIVGKIKLASLKVTCTAITASSAIIVGLIFAPPDMPCETLDQSRQMGIEVARWRRNGSVVVQAPSVPWRPLSTGTSTLFRGQGPTLRGLQSVGCELHDEDQVEITVYASTGFGSNLGTTYEGHVVITRSRLVGDIRAFELFLTNVHVGSAAREQTD